MICKKFSLNKFIGLFLLLTQFLSLSSKASPFDLQYSTRVRPLALAYSILGFEVFGTNPEGYFLGPTFHHYSEANELRSSAQSGNEWGIKFGRVFPCGVDHQGWFIMGNVNYMDADVSLTYSPTQQTFSNNIHLWYEALFVGYQFNSILFGDNPWDIRLGVGLVNRPDRYQTFTASNGTAVPVGVRKRLDPSLEFSIGYVF